MFHAGADIGFPGCRNASVEKIRTVIDNFPKMTAIAAHFGGWNEWNEVSSLLCGKNIFLDTSFINEVDPSLRRGILSRHNPELFLFGTDCPWGSQKKQVDFICSCEEISPALRDGIFYGNAARLLGIK